MKAIKVSLLAICCGWSGAVCADSFYKIDQVVSLAGKAPSWDYISVDAPHNRLFLGRRAAGVTIFDLATKKAVGTVSQSEEANAAVLVPEFDRGYTINEDGSTTIFSLSTTKTIKREKIGPSADNAFFDPKTKQLVVTMGDDQLLTFLDAKTGAVLDKLKMKAQELEGAAADGKGGLLVSERDLNAVAKIDMTTHKVVAEYPTTGCTQPTGVAYDAVDSRLFIGCKGENPVLLVMDPSDGRVVSTQPIGRGNDGVAYDAETRQVFATNGIDGNLVIYHQDSPDKYSLAQALTTRPIARTIAIDPKSKAVYTMAAQGMVDPTKKRNMRAGAFYPNVFFDNTFTLLVIGPHAGKNVPADN